ncbi:MAG: hypothetical protein Kow0090_10270 [Myxococcota bacterium]
MKEPENKLPPISESEIEKALERPTTSGGIKGVARKAIECVDLDKVLSLELKDKVNEFLDEYISLSAEEKTALKLYIVENLTPSEQKTALEIFYEMRPSLESIIKNIGILNSSREGMEALRRLIEDKRLDELVNASNRQLDQLIDVYGPGVNI